VASQVAELNVIRRSLYELESQHSKARQLYEDELSRLRLELAAAQPPPARPLGIQGLPSASGSQSQSSDAVIASASASARHEAKSSVDGDDRRRPREFNHRERDREVDRAQDGRDPKRLKTKNESGAYFFFFL
jgi:glucose repression regulatory protein TUP1